MWYDIKIKVRKFNNFLAQWAKRNRELVGVFPSSPSSSCSWLCLKIDLAVKIEIIAPIKYPAITSSMWLFRSQISQAPTNMAKQIGTIETNTCNNENDFQVSTRKNERKMPEVMEIADSNDGNDLNCSDSCCTLRLEEQEINDPSPPQYDFVSGRGLPIILWRSDVINKVNKIEKQ